MDNDNSIIGFLVILFWSLIQIWVTYAGISLFLGSTPWPFN